MPGFWDSQPVQDKGVNPGEIDASHIVPEVPNLPDGYKWSTCTSEEAFAFISEHYYDEDTTFRLKYTFDTVKWLSGEPIVIRNENEEIVGYSTYTPIELCVETSIKTFAQANFLCVHRDYRNIGFTPMLIKETVRRANDKNIWQGVATYKRDVKGSISKSKYFHRFLDVKKLVDIGFFKTNRLREKYYEIRGPCKHSWRRVTSKDVPRIVKILKSYLKDYKISPHVDESYVKKWILPIHSYISDDSDDFISFYEIPYERIDDSREIKQAYRYFIVGDVYNDAFLLAKNLGFHVFNSLDVGEDTEKLKRNKFMEGTGQIFYSLYNWCLSNTVKVDDFHVIIP